MNKSIHCIILICILCILSVFPLSSCGGIKDVESDENGLYSETPPEGYSDKVAYVSKDGSCVVGKKRYRAFTTIDAAMSALGKDGGTVYFGGELAIDAFSDIEGRSPLRIIGIDKDAVLLPGESLSQITFSGDTSLDGFSVNASDKTRIFCADGHTLAFGESFSVTESTDGKGISVGGKGADLIFNGGSFSRIAGGFVRNVPGKDMTTDGDVNITLNGGSFREVFLGSAINNAGSPAVINGSVLCTMNGGELTGNLYLGSSNSGKITGVATLVINGGTIESTCSILPGSKNDYATVGHAVVIVNGGRHDGVYIGARTKSKSVLGYEILIINNATGAVIMPQTENPSDYRITCSGGFVSPEFDGNTLLGFNIHTKVSGGSVTVSINGKKAVPDGSGLYQLPKGEVIVNVDYGLEGDFTGINSGALYTSVFGEGEFLPDSKLTRAEAAAMLATLIADSKTVENVGVSADYPDVPSDHPYAKAIALLRALGDLDGYVGNFEPDAPITRAELAALITRVCGVGAFTAPSIADVPENSGYYSAVCNVLEKGAFALDSDGKFYPDSCLTRAEAAKVFAGLLDRVAVDTSSVKCFSDIKKHKLADYIRIGCVDAETDGKTVWKTEKADEVYELPDADFSIAEAITALKNNTSVSAGTFMSGIDRIAEKQKELIFGSKNLIDPAKAKGRVFYVSAENGNDANDGLSPEKAWKSLDKVSKKKLRNGDTVLLERGNIFRITARFQTTPGVTYSAYGKGAKPVVCGSARNYADASLWEETQYENVWKLNVSFGNDIGNVFVDVVWGDGYINAVDAVKKTKGKRGFNGIGDLTDDLTYYFSGEAAGHSGYLYLCSTKGNPGSRFSDIEIGGPFTLVAADSRVTIDNWQLMFGGMHGIGATAVKDLSVTNCVLGYIGGSFWKGTARFGNAVQVYGSCDGYNVTNNYIYRIYDTAITFQYTGTETDDCHMKNIDIRGNIVENCYWSFEYYNTDHVGTDRSIENVRISDNIARYNSYGWCEQRNDPGAYTLNSFSSPEKTSDFVVSNNIFDRSRRGLVRFTADGGDKNVVLDGNVYVQSYGGVIGQLYGRFYSFDGSVADVLALNGEKNAKIVFGPAYRN